MFSISFCVFVSFFAGVSSWCPLLARHRKVLVLCPSMGWQQHGGLELGWPSQDMQWDIQGQPKEWLESQWVQRWGHQWGGWKQCWRHWAILPSLLGRNGQPNATCPNWHVLRPSDHIVHLMAHSLSLLEDTAMSFEQLFLQS